jgi:hypothetical protein
MGRRGSFADNMDSSVSSSHLGHHLTRSGASFAGLGVIGGGGGGVGDDGSGQQQQQLQQLQQLQAPQNEEKTSLPMNQLNLQRSWDVSQRSTAEDWGEWVRRFTLELLRESPSRSLRACTALAQVSVG